MFTAVTASFRKSALLALLSSASLLTLSIDAHAEDAVPQAKVSYSDLDLDNPADSKRLYKRLRVAANQVCAAYDGRDLRRAALKQTCVQRAIDKAIAEVNHPTVLALHTPQGDVRVAQKPSAQQPRG